jgi:hypothetical protein
VTNATEHAALRREIEAKAKAQGWGERLSFMTAKDGRDFHVYQNASYTRQVVHRGTETVVSHIPVKPSASLHAATNAEIAKSGKGWGIKTNFERHPTSGLELHVYKDKSHETRVLHRHGIILTHRIPRTPTTK